MFGAIRSVVLIPYTTKAYSILYKDSSNLKYDEAPRRFMKTMPAGFNGWMVQFDHGCELQAIRA